VLALLLPGLVRALLHRRKQLLATLGLPLAVAALMLVAIVSNDVRFVLAYPALVNAVLLLQFGVTLRPGSMAMVERFARLQVDELSPREQAYCRVVTASWCVFFVLNGGACALSRCWPAAPPGRSTPGSSRTSSWACSSRSSSRFRKYLFRRFGPGLLDRFFSWVFPPRPQAGPAAR